MKIIALLKRVPDTEAKILINQEGTGIREDGVKFVINPYDEYALEEAVRLVEKAGEGEVVVVTVGQEAAVLTMRSALAVGAHRGILIKVDSQFLDSFRIEALEQFRSRSSIEA